MKNLLITTAVATLFAAPVLAESATTSGTVSADVSVGNTTVTADTGATMVTNPKPIGAAETEGSIAVASDTKGVVAAGDDMMMANITVEELQGARVYDLNDAWIGEVSEIVVEPNGELGWVIVDVGGFLGMGEKPVAVAYSELRITSDAEGEVDHVMVAKTKAELEAMPEYES